MRDARVVFVHGAMDRGASFSRVVRCLEGLAPGTEAVVYDRRGYARSSHRAPGDFGTHVEDLLALLDGEEAVVFGHSLGGLIALAAATRSSLVGPVVVYEPPMRWAPWWPKESAGSQAMAAATKNGRPRPGDVAEGFLRAMMGDRRWARLPAKTREQRRLEEPALLADLSSVREVPPFDLRALRVPVVIAYGTEGAPHHRRAARELAAGIAGARLHEIAGAGHGAHLTHPRELAALLSEPLSVMRARSAS